MNRIKVISTEITNAIRRIKFFRMAGYDARTASEVGPYGFDSNPIKDMIGIYSDTLVNGRQVIVGYINKNQVADVGESRMFSTDENGVVKFYVWCKKDGKLLLGGDVNNLATFQGLKAGFDQLKNDLNDMKSKWNSFVSVYSPGGPSTPGMPATLSGQDSDPSTASIDDSKLPNHLTP